MLGKLVHLLTVASAGRYLAVDLIRAHGPNAMAVLEDMMRCEEAGSNAAEIMGKAQCVLRSMQGG